MKQASLRTRLLLSGGLGLVLVTALASALLGHLFERAARESLDARLQQDLLGLVAQAEVAPDGRIVLRQEPNDARYQRVFSGAYWQLRAADGSTLLQSRSLWDQTLQASAARDPDALPGTCKQAAATGATPAPRPAGPTALDISGPLHQPLRAITQQIRLPRATAPLQVLVAVDRSDIQEQVAQFRQRSALALAVLVAAWLGVLASQVHFGLRPLRRLGQQVERIRRGQAQRIDTDRLGAEIAPLGDELNALLDHHQRMVARARTGAQDLAHALKTPLSVLAAEAGSDGTHWRDTLREQGQRMQASIERYLAAGLAVDHRQRSEVAPVVAALCRLMSRVHGARGVSFDCADVQAELQFAGDAADLEEMLGNLLDNAGKWARGHVSARAAMDDGQLRIDVDDDGPGLAEDQLQAVLQRGVRLDERAGSSGLGLAIVGDIAASHGGRLALENRSPGLRATLWLPATASGTDAAAARSADP